MSLGNEQPTGDDSTYAGFDFGKSTGSTWYNLIAKGVTQPTAPSVGTYIYAQFVNPTGGGDNLAQAFVMDNSGITGNVASVKIWAYADCSGVVNGNPTLGAAIYYNGGWDPNASLGSFQVFDSWPSADVSAQWWSTTFDFTGSPVPSSQFSTFKMKIGAYDDASGPAFETNTMNVYGAYAEITLAGGTVVQSFIIMFE
jgi:hypothetical protein